MKFEITRSHQRGKADFGWLHANHYFSFGTYQDPNRMGFGKLRVINDDLIEPAMGFATHPHQNMEIITIPLEGAVAHKDSEGHSGKITKGEVQVMSAGSGIRHSEYNASETKQLKLFQIWIEPNKLNVAPRYDQRTFSYQDRKDEWTQLISPMDQEAEEGIKIYQNAYINISPISGGSSLDYQLKDKSNGAYILVADGEVKVGGETLSQRDSMALIDLENVTIEADSDSEVIVLEVPLA